MALRLHIALLIWISLPSGLSHADSCEPSKWLKGKSELFRELKTVERDDYVVEIRLDSETISKASYEELFRVHPELKIRTASGEDHWFDLIPLSGRKNTEVRRHSSYKISAKNLASVPGTVEKLQFVIPANSLLCNNAPISEDWVVPLVVFDKEEGKETSLVLSANWKKELEISKADDDADGDPGLAFDFNFERAWESPIADYAKEQLVYNRKAIKLYGGFSTNDDSSHDTVKVDLSFSRQWSRLGRRLPINRIGAFFRPETTSSADSLDYVYGLRWEATVATGVAMLNSKRFQPDPYFIVALERVDPDKRDDGTVPDNYNRIRAGVDWSLYLNDQLRADFDLSVARVLDNPEGVGKYQRKTTIDLVYQFEGKGNWHPFLKYTRGEDGPEYEFNNEVLIGIGYKLFGQPAPVK